MPARFPSQRDSKPGKGASYQYPIAKANPAETVLLDANFPSAEMRQPESVLLQIQVAEMVPFDGNLPSAEVTGQQLFTANPNPPKRHPPGAISKSMKER